MKKHLFTIINAVGCLLLLGVVLLQWSQNELQRQAFRDVQKELRSTEETRDEALDRAASLNADLADLKDNKAAQQAFKKGEWNLARIECRGDHIQTWINGVKAADLKDSMTLRGLIALQVHQIGDGTKKPAGEEIRWRNIRIKEL